MTKQQARYLPEKELLPMKYSDQTQTGLTLAAEAISHLSPNVMRKGSYTAA
jgi:hypothetical protein